MRPSHIACFLDGAIRRALQAKKPRDYIVPFLHGAPGTAKSALVRDAAERAGIAFWDVRLSIKDTVDLTGVPKIEKGKTVFAPPGWLPSEGPGVLFLDEYAQAMLSMQNVGGQLIYDRRAGDYCVPDGVLIVLASNRMQDRAGTTQTPQQINSRCVHIDVDADYDDWRNGYALEAGIDERIIAFLDFRPELLCQPSKDAEAFPTLRTWEYASNILAMELPPVVRNETLAGTVGKGAAAELIGFIDTFEKGVSLWRDVFANPKKAPIPDAGAPMYALMSVLARRVEYDTLETLITYLKRVNKEMANLCVHDAGRLKPVIKEHPAYVGWSVEHRIAA